MDALRTEAALTAASFLCNERRYGPKKIENMIAQSCLFATYIRPINAIIKRSMGAGYDAVPARWAKTNKDCKGKNE